jgi:hypothetical protein
MLIARGSGVKSCLGCCPGKKVSMMRMRPPQQGQGRRSYRDRLEAVAKKRIIGGITTDELMEMSRGEREEHRPSKK